MLRPLVLLLALAPPTVAGAYQEVHELDARSFEKTAEPNSVWLILFYAPW